MADTHSIITSSIANMRQDGPADGGPDPVSDGGSDPGVTDDFGGDEPDLPSGDDLDPADDNDPGERVPVAPVVADPTEKKVEEPPKDKVDEDDFEKEPEFKVDASGRKQVNRIPQPRVKKMVETAVSKAVAAKDTEHTAAVKQFEERIANYDGLGEIMATDPDRFMSMVASAYPQYKQYVKAGGEQPKPAAAEHVAANDPMPAPDARLADGTPAYSPEGFQKVQEWQARQVEGRVMKTVGEKYKWLDDQRAADQAREAAKPQIRAQMQHARENWDGFQDNFDAILTELQNDSAEAQRTGGMPKLSLHDAYRVVITKQHKAEREKLQKDMDTLKTDRNKMREEILAELRTRPSNTAAVPATAAARPDPANTDGQSRDTASIIRASISGLRRQ